MQVINQIASFFWWIVDNLSVSIDGITFNFVGAVIFGGVIGLGIKILSVLFDK